MHEGLIGKISKKVFIRNIHKKRFIEVADFARETVDLTDKEKDILR